MSLFLKRLLVQISMVSSRGMLVKNESISKLPMKLLEILLNNLSGKVKRVFDYVFGSS